MNKRLLSIIIAVVMAMLAVVMINTYLSREKAKYQVNVEQTTIVVATQDIPKGATILPNMLTTTSFPVQYIQPGVLQNPNAAFGKIALGDILKNEQILGTKLTTIKNVEDSLAVRLPKGKRAFTYPIKSINAVGGQIKVNDYIDIIGTFPYTQNIGGKAVTEMVNVTLFQNILVMDIKSSGDGQIFTLALDPKEASILSYAMTQASDLKFILRQPLDSEVKPVAPVASDALWQYVLSNLGQQVEQPQQQAQPEQQPVKSAPSTLKIYKGTSRSDMEINR